MVFQNATNTKALVTTADNPPRTCTVDLEEVRNAGIAACSIGCSVLTGLPCAHAVSVANKAGRGIEDFMNLKDTTAGWKLQYPEDLEFAIPSDADIELHAGLADALLRLPPVLRRPKGRPKGKKRAKGHREAFLCKKKRIFTCQMCFKKGHTSPYCPLNA